jgi:microcystin degradation protein MlrC
MDDAEGDWISAARTVVGPDCPIAASYDLHGNLSQRIIDQLDIFAAYRTAPHIDVRETMVRAWSMLVETLRTGNRPGVAWAKVPLLLPGECTSTEDEPAKSIYLGLPPFDAQPGILDANLMIGYVWADEPRATACAVVTGTDRQAALQAAEVIAQQYWNARENFGFGPVTGPLEDMLDIAASAETSPVILADSADNPTGGGVGDRADVLRALIARDWQGALLAGITDRPAVEACFAAGEGATLALRIGGSLDPASVSAEVSAKVLRLDDSGAAADRQAVVGVGGVTIVLAARRRPYHNIEDFRWLGLDPTAVRLLVVKSGYLSPELAPIANPNLMALTDGVVNQDIAHLASHRRARPVFPFDRDFDYAPAATLSARWRE